MMRVLAIVCFLVAVNSAWGQSAAGAAPLAFDVASVRPSKANASPHNNVPLDAGNVYGSISADDARDAGSGLFLATHQALWRYITFAYQLSGTQELALRFNMFSGAPKSGAPFWVTGSFDAAPEYFDISARAPANTSVDEMRSMMRTLLADRFHLEVHFLSADAPVFALVVAKGGVSGPALKPHAPSGGCEVSGSDVSRSEKPTEAEARPAAVPSAIGDLPPVCGVIAHVPSSSPGQHYGGRAVPLSLLASSIPTMTGLAAMPRPVVDETDLPGLYDFTLSWVHDPAGEDATVADNAASFRDALRMQLGMELKPARAPISFLIVDHVERPSEN